MATDSRGRVDHERDLYLRLLELGDEGELDELLREALGLIVGLADVRVGYLEIRGAEDNGEPWWIASGCSSEELANIRSMISRGIIAESLASGQTIVTASALQDPRFRERRSVQDGGIEAVLCGPVGAPALGVLYLQGRRDGRRFGDEDRRLVELFTRQLAPFADRLLLRRRVQRDEDPTAPFRTRMQLEGLIGRSPALAALLRQLEPAAPLDVSLLLLGESGTGKSQLARLVHQNSPRRTAPFVEVNCAALPDTLIENELFGAEKGAHSTAEQSVPGKVAAAEGGTLFLDEVGELSLPAQAKLLQLLQSREYYPLGASRPVRADVRVIAATNQDLESAVAERRFREDLYYRLTVLPVRVPALRERSEDVAELAQHACRLACERHRLPGLRLSPGALAAVEMAEWPGNVRQLAHALEAGAIRAAGEGVERVERRHVFPEEAAGEDADGQTFQEATRRFQAELLRRTLRETDWNVSEAARRLDLARSHVYHLIRSFGLERRGDAGRS